MLFPALLAERGGRAVERRVLADFLTGQYCLFLFVRIHDDILDGQHRAQRLVLTADRLAIHARALFANHLSPRSAFWKLYDDALRQTVDAIGEVDATQRTPHPSPHRLARSYARVSRVLVIASLAVCVHSGRKRDVPRVLRCGDAMATACQIMDDFRDVREDLRGGRRNYVAAAALGHPVLAGRSRSAASQAGALLAWTAVAARVLAQVQRRLHRAVTLLRGLGIEQAADLLRSYDGAVVHLQKIVFRQGRTGVRALLRGGRRRR